MIFEAIFTHMDCVSVLNLDLIDIHDSIINFGILFVNLRNEITVFVINY